MTKPQRKHEGSRLSELTGVSDLDLSSIFLETPPLLEGTADLSGEITDEGPFPHRHILPENCPPAEQRVGLFIRLCAVRLFQAGVSDDSIGDSTRFLLAELGRTGVKTDLAWLVQTDASRSIITARPYLIDAIARAKRGALILDLADAWRATL